MIDQGYNLYTAQQVREGERSVAEGLGLEMYQLMERAGSAVFNLMTGQYPQSRTIVVVCGGGNNGGDGYVVARLAKAKGYVVTLYHLGDPDKLSGDAKTAHDNWLNAGGTIEGIPQSLPEKTDLIVDALLGTGLSGRVRDEHLGAIALINASKADVVAVDIPSGLCADTGAILGDCVKANHTVSFIAPKRGLFTGQAADCTGDITMAGLGVSEQFSKQIRSDTSVISRPHVNKYLVKRDRAAHKGHNGRVLCLGGDRGMFGAIRLTSEACSRVGAGLTRVVTQPENVGAVVSARPELMVYDWRGNSNEINDHLEWADVIALGPGLGCSSWGRSLVGYSRSVEKPIVQDADGLNLLAKTPDFNSQRVITPHPGEAARLLGISVEQVESDRFAAVRMLQLKYGGVVVLKGAGSIVYDGDHYWVCIAGNPGMASGGMGDVLTGIIAGLMGQGLTLSQAARVGVWVHSTAADICAEADGERGLLASDLFPHLRHLVNKIQA